jgi:hypothetical protein
MPDPTDPAPADETTMSTNPPPASDATPTPGAGRAGDVTAEVDRWCEAFRSPGVEAIHRMATEYLQQKEDAERMRQQNAALIARIDDAEAERDEVQQARIRTYEICADSSKRLIAERDALAKFKAYVHRRLDEAGIPTDPDSLHKAEGCRIGGRLDVVFAERDALRAAVEKIPDIIRKSGEPGQGGVDITRGIPSVVYVGIGREHYADDYELARETAEYTRDEAAGAVEVFIRAALAHGPAAGETTDGGGKD